MEKYETARTDAVFSALADPTRRRIISQLIDGEASITALAKPHSMSLPAVMKHLAVLSDAGLVVREKKGRVVTCRLNPDPLAEAQAWLEHHLAFWTKRLDALDQFLKTDTEDDA
jgi:DNA-binding transcriptional ArsR family regulator